MTADSHAKVRLNEAHEDNGDQCDGARSVDRLLGSGGGMLTHIGI